jgi:glycosyltransferase involved in cell wall biosynthesis
MMKVSVALCTYNGAKYIVQQLQSISRQTVRPDEVIVCDDRSTDDTVALVEKFAAEANLPVKLYVNESNLGSTKNFEKALLLCGGDVVFLSDQDDIWMPEKVEHVLAYFDGHRDKEVVFTDGYVINEGGHTIGTLFERARFYKEQQQQWNSGQGFRLLLKNGNYATGATMSVRQRFLHIILPFETLETFIHDGIIALKASVGNRIGFLDEKLIAYRLHATQQVGFKKAHSRIHETFLSLKRKIKGAWVHRDKYLQRDIRDLKALKNLMQRYNCSECNELIDRKLAHLEKRAYYLEQPFFKKLLPLSHEWLNKNYNAFSCHKREKAWALLVKDLIGT